MNYSNALLQGHTRQWGSDEQGYRPFDYSFWVWARSWPHHSQGSLLTNCEKLETLLAHRGSSLTCCSASSNLGNLHSFTVYLPSWMQIYSTGTALCGEDCHRVCGNSPGVFTRQAIFPEVARHFAKSEHLQASETEEPFGDMLTYSLTSSVSAVLKTTVPIPGPSSSRRGGIALSPDTLPPPKACALAWLGKLLPKLLMHENCWFFLVTYCLLLKDTVQYALVF